MRTISLGICIFLSCASAFLGADDSGYLKARGKPAGAGVFVDGKYLGPASRFTVAEKLTVPAGDHEITVRDPRYEDYTTKISVRPRKTTKISYNLKPVEPAKPP